jgi:hypothetical protein
MSNPTTHPTAPPHGYHGYPKGLHAKGGLGEFFELNQIDSGAIAATSGKLTWDDGTNFVNYNIGSRWNNVDSKLVVRAARELWLISINQVNGDVNYTDIVIYINGAQYEPLNGNGVKPRLHKDSTDSNNIFMMYMSAGDELEFYAEGSNPFTVSDALITGVRIF